MSQSNEISALARNYTEAVLAKDAQRLAALYGANVRVFDAWGSRPYIGLPAWRVALDGWLTSLDEEERVQASFNDVDILSQSETGWLTALVTYAALNRTGETVRWMQNRLSWAVARSDSGWMIVHEHSSVPVGPDLKGVLQPK